jgi:hypothetical protein
MQAANDALAAILAKLDTFRGASRFTTWAYKFLLLAQPGGVGERRQRLELPRRARPARMRVADPVETMQPRGHDERERHVAVSRAPPAGVDHASGIRPPIGQHQHAGPGRAR